MLTIAHPDLHTWDVTPESARAIQAQVVNQLRSDEVIPVEGLRTVAGVDVSVKDGISRAAVVVLSFPDLAILEVSRAGQPTPFPYIPGLLTFREGEVILKAYRQLQREPDVLIFDGQGQAHPRKVGIAAHIGVWLEKPTIGCGKTWLFGQHEEPGPLKGDYEPLRDRQDAIIGWVLRTRTNVKPVYISPGHRCDIDSARRIAMACVTRYRLPEPIRAAHNAAGSSE